MKARIIEVPKKKPEFEPFGIEIMFETEEEATEMWELMRDGSSWAAWRALHDYMEAHNLKRG